MHWWPAWSKAKEVGTVILKRKETGQDPEFSLSSEKPQKDLKGVTHIFCILEKQLLKRLWRIRFRGAGRADDVRTCALEAGTVMGQRSQPPLLAGCLALKTGTSAEETYVSLLFFFFNWCCITCTQVCSQHLKHLNMLVFGLMLADRKQARKRQPRD